MFENDGRVRSWVAELISSVESPQTAGWRSHRRDALEYYDRLRTGRKSARADAAYCEER